MKVFVLNKDGTPLMPTMPARARRKLRNGKAKIERIYPFTIRLTYQIEEAETQDCTLGIDDGASHVGLAIVQHCETEDRVVFKGELKLRRNVKKLLDRRRSKRKARRRRGPHRKPKTRRKSSGLCPSAKVRKENVLRVTNDLIRQCPITSIVIEEASFNTHDKRFAFWGSQVQTGKVWLRKRLEKLAAVSTVKGWETAKLREFWDISKSHANDAVAIALNCEPWQEQTAEYKIKARRRRNDVYSRKYDEFAGFRHWDVVRYTKLSGETFLGTVRSLLPGVKAIKCRLPFNENYKVSVGRLQLVERPKSIVYLPINKSQKSE